MSPLRIAAVPITCLLWGSLSASEQLPRRVIVLDQSTPYTEYFGKLFASFQSTLKTGSDVPTTIHLERLGYTYVNAGIVENKTVFPPVFPKHIRALLRVALKRAPEANYHLLYLPRVAPWLTAFRAASQPKRLEETARLMRPLFARAVDDHEELLTDAQATSLLRKNGWLKLYRTDPGLAALARELDLAKELGLPFRVLDTAGAQELEPSLAPVFRHAILWENTASVTNPLAVTRAYAARFIAL